MPVKKKSKKADSKEEQLQLLRQILAELQTLNANLAAAKANSQLAEAGAPSDNDDDELEEYE